MAGKACSDTGPILHLNEINQLKLLKVFSKIIVSEHVREELFNYKIKKLPKSIELKPTNKDQVALLAEKHSLDIAESSVIWLCKSLRVPLMLTDDLDARQAAATLDVKPIGTVGIVVRAFREKIISEKEAIDLLKSIYEKSSLFVTSTLIKYAVNEIRKFRR